MLSMQFAKTDLQTHYDFTQQAENYRIALVRDLNYDLKDNSNYGDWDYISKEKDFFKKNVKFDYKPLHTVVMTRLIFRQ
jgi:ABC-2 type transport system permease protein